MNTLRFVYKSIFEKQQNRHDTQREVCTKTRKWTISSNKRDKRDNRNRANRLHGDL